MLIHPWDAAAPDEWRRWLGTTAPFIQFTCDATIVANPEDKARLLRTQLRHLQPAGDHAVVDVAQPPYGRMLPGLQGLRLDIVEIVAKFKFDDHNPIEHRERVIARLHERGGLHDLGAAEQQARRIAERGEWAT